MARCSNCGSGVKSDWVACPKCGALLEAAPTQEAASFNRAAGLDDDADDNGRDLLAWLTPRNVPPPYGTTATFAAGTPERVNVSRTFAEPTKMQSAISISVSICSSYSADQSSSVGQVGANSGSSSCSSRYSSR